MKSSLCVTERHTNHLRNQILIRHTMTSSKAAVPNNLKQIQMLKEHIPKFINEYLNKYLKLVH